MDGQQVRLGEDAARRVVLVRAIEEADPQGRLVGAPEREQIEVETVAALRAAAPGAPLEPAAYLQRRASGVLAAVEHRNARIAALQHADAWPHWLAWALPLAAVAIGTALDRIDNPGHVNMLSPPLLAVLLWNLLAYLLLLLAPLRPARWRGAAPGGGLQRLLARVPAREHATGRLRPDIQSRFLRLWLHATGRQQALWWQQLLHATAAAWAVGLALSIVIGGVVREYRVGWESTLLDVGHVHAFLSLLFAPVVALFPFEPFSLADLQRMAFGSGAAIGPDEARRWVWMYLALLGLVVVLPRALLAGLAYARRRRLAAGVPLDLGDAYFRELLARVQPARITLGLLATDGEGRSRLLRMFRDVAQAGGPPGPGAPWTVLTSPKGDLLQVLDLQAQEPAPAPAAAPAAGAGGWRARWALVRTGEAPAPAPAPQSPVDLVLLVPARRADVEHAQDLLVRLARPVLLLVPRPAEEGGPQVDAATLRRAGIAADLHELPAWIGAWPRDREWLGLLRERLPASRHAGFDRLAAAWQERLEQRFTQAMALLAGLLVRAAGEREEVASAGAGGLRRLLGTAEREAELRAREAALGTLLQRVALAESDMVAEIARLHGLELPQEPVRLARSADGQLVPVAGALRAPQAGLAGAASGAALGASIDLMTGGLTLGAAAALGAVVGGGASLAAAAWRNRDAPTLPGQMQLSDEMLQTLAEALLLRYLAIAVRSRSDGDEEPPLAAWRSEVVAAVEARRERLAPLWQRARAGAPALELQPALAEELAPVARAVLQRA